MSDVRGFEGIVARADIQRDVDALLAHPPLDSSAPAGLLLTGPAGIGKTAIWEWGVDRAVLAGWRVLSFRCSAAEAALPWVALTDLVERCGDEARAQLPEPQRDALDVVTLRARAGPVPPDERAVGTGLRSLLIALAADAPVLIALDDVGYLDPASAKALQFALRRLSGPMPIRMIATAREPGPSPLEALAGGFTSVGVGPLSVAGAFELIRSRLQLVFSRPLLIRIHEASGGNALYALEIARALDRREITPAAGMPLDLPDTLRSLVADRIQRAGGILRTIAAATAVATRLPAAQVDEDVLAAGILEALLLVDEGAVRATHPLIATTAYASLSEDERVELHYALAGDSVDPIERARHLALAVATPDPEVAAALDEATATATARGATDAAAQLARLAVDRTGDADPTRAARLQRLADLLLRAGDTAGAVRAGRDAVAASAPGSARARQLIRHAEVLAEADGLNAAMPILNDAIREAGADRLAAAEAHLTIAAVSYDDLRAANLHAERAADLVQSIAEPDPTVLAGVLMQAAGARFRVGHGLDHERFRRAIALETAHPSRRLSDRADASYAALLKYADDLDGSGRLLAALLAEAVASGDMSSIAYVRSHLPQLALFRGDVTAARAAADAYRALAESAGLTTQLNAARFLSSLVATYAGDVSGARTLMESELAGEIAAGARWGQQRLNGALGFLAWSSGDAATAVACLDRWHALMDEIGLGEPGYARYHLDYAEALLAVGRLDDAGTFLDGLAAQARLTERGYAFAAVATGRALLAAARRDLPEAQKQIAEALRLHADLPLRFDRARTLLAAGHVHRRARAKLAARDAFTEARDEFASMGAPLWAARAEDALARVNIRPAASLELTDAERRVAELAANGLTNRQVASQLFLAQKTVEANLARIYEKLGISSRAELGARLGRRD